MIIGLAGGTGSGKSMIVQSLVARVGGRVIDLDSYYCDRSALSREERSRINYDQPTAIDVALLVGQLAELERGEAVRKPVYSFETHERTGVEMVAPARLLLVEGRFALWWESLRSLLDVKVFVDAPPDLRLIRRIRRDLTGRDRTLEQVLQQYSGALHARAVRGADARPRGPRRDQ